MEIKYKLTSPIFCPFDKRIGSDNSIKVQVGSMVCRHCEHKINMSYNKRTGDYTVNCNHPEGKE